MVNAIPKNPELVNKSEKIVFEELLKLGDDWDLYSNISQHITLFEHVSRGEIDFILVHDKYGLILLEVKGYGVICENGSWYRETTYSNGKTYKQKTKSPYRQLEDARGNLKSYIAKNKGILKKSFDDPKDLNRIPIHVFAVFPFLPEFISFGPESENTNTVTQKELENFQNFLSKILKNTKPFKAKYFRENIRTLLAPNVHTTPMKGLTTNTQKEIISATEEQAVILNAVFENNDNIFVSGPAGSGKTLMAVEAAKYLSQKNKKILFLCYNQNLSKFLRNLFIDYKSIKVSSLFGLFSEIDVNLKDSGTSNMSPKEAAPVIADLLNNNFDKFNQDFDVLIIDEAQDYSPLFWTTFSLLTENKKWFLFADRRQAITHDDWELPGIDPKTWVSFPLSKYLRGTKEISERVLDVYKDDYIPTSISGFNPEFITLSKGGWKEALEMLSATLTGLFENEKYDPSQVQVLIPHSRYLEEVEQAEYKPNQKIGGVRDIRIESIYKYKGLESEIVVMVIPNIESLESENTSDIKSLLYVGMSRATSMLIVISNKEVKKLANWSS